MSDRRLQVFYTVARVLSFTKAAEELHMTQPAVTFQIRQLEEYYNTRLFDRTHNRVSLTEAGKLIYRYAERIFDLYTDLDKAVREITGDVSGTLTVGASTTIAEYMLPQLLGAFRSSHPEVQLRLMVSNTDGIVSMIENNIIDLGVVEAPVANKNLIVEDCREDEMVLVVPPGHHLASRESVKVRDIMDCPFICREEGSGTREVVNEYLENQGVTPSGFKQCLELGNSESIKGAVEAGIGITVLSKVMLDKELRLGLLLAIPLDPPLVRTFSFVRQRQKFRIHAMEELLEFAHEYCDSNR